MKQYDSNISTVNHPTPDIIVTKTGFLINGKHITHMESKLEKKPFKKIPKKVLRRWREILRMHFDNEIDKQL